MRTKFESRMHNLCGRDFLKERAIRMNFRLQRNPSSSLMKKNSKVEARTTKFIACFFAFSLTTRQFYRSLRYGAEEGSIWWLMISHDVPPWLACFRKSYRFFIVHSLMTYWCVCSLRCAYTDTERRRRCATTDSSSETYLFLSSVSSVIIIFICPFHLPLHPSN